LQLLFNRRDPLFDLLQAAQRFINSPFNGENHEWEYKPDNSQGKTDYPEYDHQAAKKFHKYLPDKQFQNNYKRVKSQS